jgi:hypothetical protein
MVRKQFHSLRWDQEEKIQRRMIGKNKVLKNCDRGPNGVFMVTNLVDIRTLKTKIDLETSR